MSIDVVVARNKAQAIAALMKGPLAGQSFTVAEVSVAAMMVVAEATRRWDDQTFKSFIETLPQMAELLREIGKAEADPLHDMPVEGSA